MKHNNNNNNQDNAPAKSQQTNRPTHSGEKPHGVLTTVYMYE